jgi:hypothetical protein
MRDDDLKESSEWCAWQLGLRPSASGAGLQLHGVEGHSTAEQRFHKANQYRHSGQI